ncbi:hypothetical protein GCM10022217_22660 [Chryseobacterium ginsenosidimutans]|uniref:hypothetical protein n=1 Tax=Chryseobacterium ginsenosidimutans TaxID=687846 RepID=UPI0031D6D60B
MSNEINISGIDSTLVDESQNLAQTNTSSPQLLKNKKIAISVSVNEDLCKLGFSEQHLNDISLEIARYVLINDGIAMYCGDLREGGFTKYFTDLSNQYKKPDDEVYRFKNYFAYPYKKNLTRNVLIDFKSKKIDVVIMPPPSNITYDDEKKYDVNNIVEDRYTYCECFREMREKVSKESDARIVIGGKVENYLGYVPGILEEALYSLIENKPVYIIGGFGGAAKEIVNILEGKEAKEFRNDKQYSNDFLIQFKNYISDKYPFYDYDTLLDRLKSFTIHEISANNKLSIEENVKLFHSTNIHEITYYLIKGLKKL